jgi:hypothetical protein
MIDTGQSLIIMTGHQSQVEDIDQTILIKIGDRIIPMVASRHKGQVKKVNQAIAIDVAAEHLGHRVDFETDLV